MASLSVFASGGAVDGTTMPLKEGANDAIPAPADGKYYQQDDTMEMDVTHNNLDDAPAADLLSSAATSPAASVMSDPFGSSPSSSFSSTASSMVFPLKSILKNGIKPAEQCIESDSEDDDEDLSDGSESEIDSEASDAEDRDDDEDDEDDDEEGEDDDEYDDTYDEFNSEIENCMGLRTGFSFISFSNNVRFAETETIVIISSYHEPEPAAEEKQAEMTCHEKMLLAQAAQNSNAASSVGGRKYDSEEHSPEIVDLDKHLLIAYINGLSTINARHCRPILRSRTVNVKNDNHAKPKVVSDEADEQVHEYLDRILDLVLGFFPNLFTDEEYAHILDQAQLAIAFDDVERLLYLPQAADVQTMLQNTLQEKLSLESADLIAEVLAWLAGELLEPLGRRASSRNAPSCPPTDQISQPA